MMELDFEDTKKEVLEHLARFENIVLSTCSKKTVTSRMMCFANDGPVVYFLTAKRSRKCKQIEENENVSLCIDNVQIEGKARMIGHPLDNDAKIREIFKNKHGAFL